MEGRTTAPPDGSGAGELSDDRRSTGARGTAEHCARRAVGIEPRREDARRGPEPQDADELQQNGTHGNREHGNSDDERENGELRTETGDTDRDQVLEEHPLEIIHVLSLVTRMPERAANPRDARSAKC